jgi:hypothetical protein
MIEDLVEESLVHFHIYSPKFYSSNSEKLKFVPSRIKAIMNRYTSDETQDSLAPER